MSKSLLVSKTADQAQALPIRDSADQGFGPSGSNAAQRQIRGWQRRSWPVPVPVLVVEDLQHNSAIKQDGA